MIPDLVITLPEDWRTAGFDPNFIDITAEHEPSGSIVVNAMLEDGTTIIALKWRGGQRLARCSNDGVIDEHYRGEFPKKHRKALAKLWSIAVDCLVRAKHDAEREFGPHVVKTDRDRARWLLSNAPGAAEGLQRAYEMLHEQAPDLTFETFRELVEHEAKWVER